MYRACIVVSLNNEYELTNHFINHILSEMDSGIQMVVAIDGLNDVPTLRYLSEISEHYTNIEVMHHTVNLGYSVSNNMAAARADAEYLIFMNSDTFPTKNSLKELIHYMDTHSVVGVTQGMILYPQTNKVQSTGHVFSFFKTAHAYDGASINDPWVNKESERQALCSAFYITRRKKH